MEIEVCVVKEGQKRENLKYESIERVKKRNSPIRQGKPEAGREKFCGEHLGVYHLAVSRLEQGSGPTGYVQPLTVDRS